ncbi:hypothetical protein F3Y22_tig00111409pilonHSYRG00117 [Hibiscus syriacus]|uniref:Uncharacterized protein n=1 Tax=Hibiscus syriacus TaxID=106335 RepID=A0A6A2YFV0_HIBSY|nr:hypothetical protein F3Y22_tig00111409pilonHSYRG00117 [Hibiscus syriacus]
METSSLNSNSNQFPLLDMVLLFHGFSCYNTIKSFFSRYCSSSLQSQTPSRLGPENPEIWAFNHESGEQLSESFGSEEISRLFEEEPS